MISYALQRVAQCVIVVYCVVTIVFVVTRVVGDPAKAQLGLTSTAEQRAAYNAALGYDRPILVQYWDFITGAVRGDLGESSLIGRPALGVVMEALPNTLLLVSFGMLLAILFGVIGGSLAASRDDGVVGRIVSTVAMVGISTPTFWVGIFLAMVFGVYLKLLPVAGSGEWKYIVLPALTLALPIGSRIMLMVRAVMRAELSQPYILAAESRGVPRRDLVFRHAMRNAIIPVLALIGWEYAVGVAGYATSVEVVFNWSGIGLLALRSLQDLDFEVVQAVVIVVAVFVVLINLATDLLFMVIDPKVRRGMVKSRG